MARNQNCNCLCHGADGNYTGDVYFSCKNCYAANHMAALPRREARTKPAPRAKKAKAGAMEPIVQAAEELKWEQKTQGTASLKVPVVTLEKL